MHALTELFRDSVIFVDGTMAELEQDDERRLSERLLRLIQTGRDDRILVVIPHDREGRWSLTVTQIVDNLASITAYDSVREAKEAEHAVAETRALMERLLKDHADNLHGLPAVSEWPSAFAICIENSQTSDVVIHILCSLAGISPPQTTDRLLWRRLIAAFFSAYQHRPDTGRNTLFLLREAHDSTLTAVQGTVSVSIPENSADLKSCFESTPVTVREAQEMTQALHDRGTKMMISAADEKLRIDRDLAIRREQTMATALAAGKMVADLRIRAFWSKRAYLSSPGGSSSQQEKDGRAAKTIAALKASLSIISAVDSDDPTAKTLKERIEQLTEEKEDGARKALLARQAVARCEQGFQAMEEELKCIRTAVGLLM